jgi:large conductance mechanosensitive channel
LSVESNTGVEQKTTLWSGFREFLMRGNVVELAVAVVVGTAFSKIVDAVVKGLINPLVGAIGTQDLEKYQFCLKSPCKVDPATGEVLQGGVAIRWGPVLSASLTFLITAAVVYFLMIVPMNKYKERRAEKNPAPPAGPTEIELLTEIRDALVSQRTGADPAGDDGVDEDSTASGSVGQQRGAVNMEK